ncbi:hypothetical protein GCM10007415_03170 [Parapedobacter pyrenivorans]|uniref:Molybdopterin molybdenumtransferase n=1 Tax=Parapedobacter pyrenivorans TaxID=1305674 RepID=A0A917HCM8_9SPHI|nr:gephyrin-like molybdotransferase Glp [Parapedobacter pyrenivorans]GGG74971.1 hypothetical protein GCM10007415_03170 [Parapedobacter pyrenivorans]
MIGVQEAKEIIRARIEPLAAREVRLDDAWGCMLAEDCAADGDFPPFDQAAVDGYAFRFADIASGALRLAGAVAAGSRLPRVLEAQTAVRIFTGAPMPAQADTVVMQELAKVADGQLVIDDRQLQQRGNVRPQGSDIQEGTVAMQQGTVLSPAAIGFLAGIGRSAVVAVPRPRVCIIVTGNELAKPGQPLQHGQVYESNSYALRAALQQLQVAEVVVRYVGDDLSQTTEQLDEALQSADVVLVSGGISVGDYDYVNRALKQCEVEKQFYKVRQKPGKPLYFGTKGQKPVFGLPGNPASVLVCFYEYVVPALELLTQRRLMPEPLQLAIASQGQKKPGLTHFLKGYFNENDVQVLSAQESYRLRSFAVSNCLVCLPEAMESFNQGMVVQVQPLP